MSLPRRREASVDLPTPTRPTTPTTRNDVPSPNIGRPRSTFTAVKLASNTATHADLCAKVVDDDDDDDDNADDDDDDLEMESVVVVVVAVVVVAVVAAAVAGFADLAGDVDDFPGFAEFRCGGGLLAGGL